MSPFTNDLQLGEWTVLEGVGVNGWLVGGVGGRARARASESVRSTPTPQHRSTPAASTAAKARDSQQSTVIVLSTKTKQKQYLNNVEELMNALSHKLHPTPLPIIPTLNLPLAFLSNAPPPRVSILT